MSQIKFDHLPHEVCRITSKFGYRTDPITGAKGTFHQGIDIGAKRAGVQGDRLFAVKDGKVVWTGSMMDKTYGYGHYTIIQHKGFCSLYAHKKGLMLRVNDTIKAGQLVGYMGTTGASTAAHLHFEIAPIVWTGYTNYIAKQNGVRKHNIDPYPFIEELLSRKEVDEVVRYKNISEMPSYYQQEVKKLVDQGIIKGNTTGDLNMTEDMIRTLIMAGRMDKLKV